MRDTARRSDPIAKGLVAYAAVLCASAIVSSSPDDSIVDAFNIIAPASILLIGLTIGMRLLATSSMYVLSPVTWFYLASAAYFGLGPLSFAFATAETVNFIQTGSQYPLDRIGIFQSIMLSVAGITCVTLAILAGRALMPWRTAEAARFVDGFDVSSAKPVLWVFIAVGATVQYLFTLPHVLGLGTWVLPGAVQQLSLLLQAAIVIAMLLVWRGERRYLLVLLMLVASELGAAMLTNSKLAIILVLVALGVGRYLTTQSMRGMVILASFAALVYAFVLSPFVAFARLHYKPESGTDLGALIRVMELYLTEPDMPDWDGVQGWWMRFNISNYSKFAIDAYERGEPGTTLHEIVFTLVPRVIFPDKPVSAPGKILSELLYPGSSEWAQTSMGYFAEGYWNGGVTGLILVCIWVGLVLAGSTSFLFGQLARLRVGMLFVALIFIQNGLGVEFWFVGTFVGGLVLTMCYALLIWILFYAFKSGANRPVAPPALQVLQAGP